MIFAIEEKPTSSFLCMGMLNTFTGGKAFWSTIEEEIRICSKPPLMGGYSLPALYNKKMEQYFSCSSTYESVISLWMLLDYASSKIRTGNE